MLSPWPSVWRYIGVETGPRRQPKDPKSSKIRKREMWRRSRGARLGDRPGGPSHEKTAAIEGQGCLGLRWKEGQEGRTKESAMPQLSPPFLSPLCDPLSCPRSAATFPYRLPLCLLLSVQGFHPNDPSVWAKGAGLLFSRGRTKFLFDFFPLLAIPQEVVTT